ncbi:MAG TPA: HEAT repeat domain-containing protein [Candidatus Rubrimentiphilum sp.]|nr:HEAT repeat domain-containing protein [Candidatus Rubrimentiphilum sp.]
MSHRRQNEPESERKQAQRAEESTQMGVNSAKTLAAFIIVSLVVVAWTPAQAATVNVPANIAVLEHSANPQQLIDACKALVPKISIENSEAAFAAVKQFILSGHNTHARNACARTLSTISILSFGRDKNSRNYSPYVSRANDVLLTMLENRNPAIRVGAANAMWGALIADDGRALLRHANGDSDQAVVAASLQNMHWGMVADVAITHDAQAYDNAIARSLHSGDEDILIAALSAYGGLHRLGAVPLLSRYALDKRPAVRAGAIAAFGAMQMYNKQVLAFIESRLADPNIDVRYAVMLQLMRFGDSNALPAIEKLARTAPTAKERASAAEYAKAIAQETAPQKVPSPPPQ